MGDLVRTVRIAKLNSRGALGKAVAYRAIIDTGTTRTVIPERIMRATGVKFLKQRTNLGGKSYPLVLLIIWLIGDKGDDCAVLPIVMIVSDELAQKAGPDVDVILGHDYLQGAGATLRYDTNPHQVTCVTGFVIKNELGRVIAIAHAPATARRARSWRRLRRRRSGTEPWCSRQHRAPLPYHRAS